VLCGKKKILVPAGNWILNHPGLISVTVATELSLFSRKQ